MRRRSSSGGVLVARPEPRSAPRPGKSFSDEELQGLYGCLATDASEDSHTEQMPAIGGEVLIIGFLGRLANGGPLMMVQAVGSSFYFERPLAVLRHVQERPDPDFDPAHYPRYEQPESYSTELHEAILVAADRPAPVLKRVPGAGARG